MQEGAKTKNAIMKTRVYTKKQIKDIIEESIHYGIDICRSYRRYDFSGTNFNFAERTESYVKRKLKYKPLNQKPKSCV